ncbi:MAG: ABC transporter permease [Opitutales bacterium]|nr:ABC transporter permease [Opitutales bacterium]
MRQIWTIAYNDLRIFLRDKSSIVWLVLIPLAFVYFTSFASRPSSDPHDARTKVEIRNLDSGFLGDLFVETLGQQGIQAIEPEGQSNSQHSIAIPEDFTDKVLDKKVVHIEFMTGPDGGSEPLSALAEASLVRTIIAFNGYLLEHATLHSGEPLTNESMLRIIGTENPVSLQSGFAGKDPIPVGFNMSLPGIIVMYLLMNLLLYGGASMAENRRNGILRRMSVHPLTNTQILFGKLTALMMLACVQIGSMLLFGQFLFGVNIGSQLLPIIVTLLVFSWVSASLGILLGSIIKAEDRVIGISIMIAIPTAALGGCWWPLEIVPDFMQIAAHFTPSAWAMKSLHGLITYGNEWRDVIQWIGVLACFGLVSNLLAIRNFRV